MTTATVLLIVFVVFVALPVFFAVRIFEALRKTLLDVTSLLVDSHRLIDRLHEREIRHRKDLENRLMARDFDHYQTYELAGADQTTLQEPDEVPDSEIRAGRPWIQGPPEPQDTPQEIIEDLEKAGA